MANILTPGSFLLLFVFSSVISSTRSQENYWECHPNDIAALLKFKAAFPPDAFPTWDTMVGCCNWRSVGCDSVPPHRVNELGIANLASLRGSIPPAIGDLEFLERFGLFGLPNLVGSIPRELTKLRNLSILIIAQTSLSTPIPSFIEEIPSLLTLILREYNHSGPIPGWINQNWIRGLYLDLSKNSLSGPIPRSFGNVNFNYIDLSRNQLTGDASFLFGQSKLVASMDLSMNKLDFDLTDVVFPEASLGVLHLDNNQIRGSIPPQIANVTNLRSLNLSYNHLCGRIPTGGIWENSAHPATPTTPASASAEPHSRPVPGIRGRPMHSRHRDAFMARCRDNHLLLLVIGEITHVPNKSIMQQLSLLVSHKKFRNSLGFLVLSKIMS